ncbi:hypothetical protein F5144DRAFT_578579 [Chaetomium tenue]|uniref:Uncharacterized protein n=1 Tax=Chaetomium tenue TaxID=1854479 RepID=A0ACB7P6S3_9PEZI|nr:hypothetical protein F5144DRAFT_578579 [Chaetomium globosum]
MALVFILLFLGVCFLAGSGLLGVAWISVWGDAASECSCTYDDSREQVPQCVNQVTTSLWSFLPRHFYPRGSGTAAD